MKNLFTTVLFIFTVQSLAFSQASIGERTNSADLVVEGKVTKQESFWNPEGTAIFTKNTLEIYKVFKGHIEQGEIEIITKGGIVGDDFQFVTHTFQVKQNVEGGIFPEKCNRVWQTQFLGAGHSKPANRISTNNTRVQRY